MITKDKLLGAFIEYVDNEIIAHFNDWRKWAFAGYVALAMDGISVKYDALLQNQFIKDLGLVSEKGMVDSKKLFDTLRTVAKEQGEISQVIPILGVVTFKIEDVDTLEKYVKEAAA